MSSAKDWRERVKQDESLPDIGEVIMLAKDVADDAIRWRDLHPKKDFSELYEDKKDGSPVTQADKEASQKIIKRLGEISNIPVVSEETDEGANLDILKQAKGTYWCVDPIDGTSSFAKGGHDWGVLIGLVKDGVPVEGVAFYPEIGGPQGQLYYTQDGKAFLEERAGTRQLVVESKPKDQRLRVGEYFKEHHPGFDPTKMLVRSRKQLPSGNGDVPPQPELMVARGDLDISFRSQNPPRQTPSVWDSAAPLAILAVAGGVALAHDGQGNNMNMIDWVNPDPNLKMRPFIAGGKETMKTHGLIGRAEELLLKAGAASRSTYKE